MDETEHDDGGNGSREDSPPQDVSHDVEGLSLDDLGAAYARAAARHDPEAFVEPPQKNPDEATKPDAVSGIDDTGDDEQSVHPEGIVEAALFVGHPENQAFTAKRLASLMRDVTENEVVEMIERLNESYKSNDQALRIVEHEGGYRLTIAPSVENVRQSFLGKVRETRLSQAAIEVLALVAYQPGINAQKVQDQRGKESGALLNQLVRRRLLEIKRIAPEGGGRKLPHYYPTERFLALFDLQSLEDLPIVDEGTTGL